MFGNDCCTIQFVSFLLESGPLVEDDHSIVVADQGNPSGQMVAIVLDRCLGRFVDGHCVVAETVMRALRSNYGRRAAAIFLLSNRVWLAPCLSSNKI